MWLHCISVVNSSISVTSHSHLALTTSQDIGTGMESCPDCDCNHIYPCFRLQIRRVHISDNQL